VAGVVVAILVVAVVVGTVVVVAVVVTAVLVVVGPNEFTTTLGVSIAGWPLRWSWGTPTNSVVEQEAPPVSVAVTVSR
jgi:hypothetical protein